MNQKKFNPFKLTLISLHGEYLWGKSLHYYNPLAVTTLAGYLKEHMGENIEIRIFDSMIQPYEEIISETSSFNPDLTGISLKTDSLWELRKIMKLFSSQKETEGMKIVLGGITATIIYNELLDEFPNVYIARGDGEYPLLKLIKNMTKKCHIKNVPNIVYKNSSKQTIKNESYYFDLSELKYKPEDHFTEKVKETGGDFWIEAGRGCSMACSFCSKTEAHFGSPGHRRFPLSRTIERIRHINKKFGISNFRFSDEDFINDDFDFILNFCEEIKKLNFKFTFEIDASIKGIYREKEREDIKLKRREIWKKMPEAGLRHIFIGIESLSDRQLKRYQKGITVSDIIKALEKLEISYAAGFIPFDPFVTVEELLENFSNLKSTGIIYNINTPIKFMRVQKGTKIAEMTEKAGLITGETENRMCYTYKFQSKAVEKICEIIKKTSPVFTAYAHKLNYLIRPTAAYQGDMEGSLLEYFTLKNRELKDIELEFLINLTKDNNKLKEIENNFLERTGESYFHILEKSREIKDREKREKLQELCKEFMEKIKG